MMTPATLSRSSHRSPTIGPRPRVQFLQSKPNPYSTGLAGLGDSSSGQSSGISNAIGIVSIIQSLTGIGIAIANLFKGCGQTCVQATNIANQVAGLLQQNLNQYMSQPVHYASVQAAALRVFDGTWAQLQQACGNTQLGVAGQKCISDRQAGACTWKASPGGWAQGADGTWKYTGYGASGSGSACWNWFIGYRDPIANDPTVVPDPVTQTVQNTDGSTTTTTVTVDPTTGVPTSTISTAPASITSQLSSLTSSIPTPLLLVGGALVVLALTGGLD